MQKSGCPRDSVITPLTSLEAVQGLQISVFEDKSFERSRQLLTKGAYNVIKYHVLSPHNIRMECSRGNDVYKVCLSPLYPVITN